MKQKMLRDLRLVQLRLKSMNISLGQTKTKRIFDKTHKFIYQAK